MGHNSHAEVAQQLVHMPNKTTAQVKMEAVVENVRHVGMAKHGQLGVLSHVLAGLLLPEPYDRGNKPSTKRHSETAGNGAYRDKQPC